MIWPHHELSALKMKKNNQKDGAVKMKFMVEGTEAGLEVGGNAWMHADLHCSLGSPAKLLAA
jgi:hypothetical protein